MLHRAASRPRARRSSSHTHALRAFVCSLVACMRILGCDARSSALASVRSRTTLSVCTAPRRPRPVAFPPLRSLGLCSDLTACDFVTFQFCALSCYLCFCGWVKPHGRLFRSRAENHEPTFQRGGRNSPFVRPLPDHTTEEDDDEVVPRPDPRPPGVAGIVPARRAAHPVDQR